jgi:hypothetical protein
MLVNAHGKFCYRIYHIQNLPHVVQAGLCTKHHPDANPLFVSIGNTEIIDTRDSTAVRIPEFGNIGDYVPFYFTPRSIMLFNIITGYRAPLVPKLPKSDIIIIQAEVEKLSHTGRFFFTDGQANVLGLSHHYSDLADLDKIDWESIQRSDFTKNGDPDRPRRYQAEFLVHHHVPLAALESIIVYDASTAAKVTEMLNKAGSNLKVNIIPQAFF